MNENIIVQIVQSLYICPTNKSRAIIVLNTANKYRRAYLALNLSSYPDVLEMLANDTDYNVRVNVASNPSVTAEILAKLCSDESHYVRVSAKRASARL